MSCRSDRWVFVALHLWCGRIYLVMLSVSDASRSFCHAERSEASRRFFAPLRMTGKPAHRAMLSEASHYLDREWEV